MSKTLLVDAREFKKNKITGIGRVLTGLINSVVKYGFTRKIDLAGCSFDDMPENLKQSSKIHFIKIPKSFIKSELFITRLTHKENAIFLSPYPKLPF
jgi:hypothetical protein